MKRPMSLRSLARTGVAGVVLSTSALGQLCSIPCNGTQVVCHHQNGIRNHRGGPTVPLEGPNAATGNVAGDAHWKIWGCENGMTRGSAISTFTGWEIGLANVGTGTATFDIPDLALRLITGAGSTAGVRETDMTGAPIYSAAVGSISMPTGGFRINVSIQTPVVALPANCPPTTGLPTLSNSDVAMLFRLTPGEVNNQATYYRNLGLDTEVNTVSNPSPLAPGAGNSYSGRFDASLNLVTHFAIQEELFAEMAFFEPTLEVYRNTTGFAAPTRGSGARELAAGDSFFFRTEDWEAGLAAINGQDRLAVVMISDDTAGSPLCIGPPCVVCFVMVGSLFLPGSAGVLWMYPTAMTIGFLNYSAALGAGMNCHFTGDVPCSPNPPDFSVMVDLQATTPAIPVPPGMSGLVLYAASFAFNFTTLTLDDGSNTVELLFL